MKSKSNIFTELIIRIVIFLLFLAGFKYILETGNTLCVFGHFIPHYTLVYVWVAAFCAVLFVKSICGCVSSFRKDKKKIGSDILRTVTVCMIFVTFALRMKLTEPVTAAIAYEIIDLSDGSKVCINERGSYNTYLDVYQINGIIAKSMTGGMHTDFSSQHCIENGKWDYTYNESDKKLTILLYDNTDGTDEDDGTEVAEYEFTLK